MTAPLANRLTPAVAILPYVIADTSVTGTGMGFATQDANGIRPLYASEYDASPNAVNTGARRRT